MTQKAVINMRIESDSFRELYVPQHVLAAKDERFYEIPGAKDYAISSYGRLFKRLGEFKYKLVRPINIDSPGVLTREGYTIRTYILLYVWQYVCYESSNRGNWHSP